MRIVRFVLLWLLAPRRLLAGAGLLAAAAFLAAYASVHDTAARKLALRQGPPPAVAVEDYRAMLHKGPAGEVVLRARADLASAFVFTLPGTSESALLMPLFPLGDEGTGVARGAVFVRIDGQAPDAAALVARDPSGWVEVNGVEADAGPFRLMLAGALAAEGRSLGPRTVVLRPFVEGREAALQPPANPHAAWGWLALAALGLGLAAAFVDARGVRSAAKGAPHVSRAPVASTRFAPLPRQEEDGAGRIHAVRGALAVGWSVSVRLSRALAAGLRHVWAGIGEIRSPR